MLNLNENVNDPARRRVRAKYYSRTFGGPGGGFGAER
jgi:hypothetical protein